jgi:hypothetical protein
VEQDVPIPVCGKPFLTGRRQEIGEIGGVLRGKDPAPVDKGEQKHRGGKKKVYRTKRPVYLLNMKRVTTRH